MTWMQDYYTAEDAEPPPSSLRDIADLKALDEQLALLREIRKPPPSRWPDEAFERQLDLTCQRLCAAYAGASSNVRAHLRIALTGDQSYLLLQYSRQCAKMGWRSGNQDLLRSGLIANTVAGFRYVDIRDSIVAIEEILKACAALHMDAEQELERACVYAGPTFGQFLRDVAESRRSTSR